MGALRTITIRGVNPAGPPFKNPPAWRLRKDLNGGGIFVNWGCYDLDYLLGLLDFKLTPQYALARTLAGRRADYILHRAGLRRRDARHRAHHFRRGLRAELRARRVFHAAADNRWQITGERGTLTLQMLKAKTANVVLTEPDAEKGTRTRVIWEGDESQLTSEHDGVVA